MNILGRPPSTVKDFDWKWKEWLWNLYTWTQDNMNKDFYFEVGAERVNGHAALNVPGHDSTISTTIATIGNNLGILQPYSTTADIDSISSDNAGDTHDITIEGLDVNYNEVAAQTVTLSGQTRVAIPTSLFRVTKIYNATSTATQGLIWVYVNTALTSGKPTDTTKIRSSIHKTSGPSNERSTNSVYTTPTGKTGYIVFGKTTVTDNKAMDLSFWGRASTGVFQMQHHVNIKDNNYDYFFRLPLQIPEKTDIEVRATVGAGTAEVSATYDIILVDN